MVIDDYRISKFSSAIRGLITGQENIILKRSRNPSVRRSDLPHHESNIEDGIVDPADGTFSSVVENVATFE